MTKCRDNFDFFFYLSSRAEFSLPFPTVITIFLVMLSRFPFLFRLATLMYSR